MKRILFWIAVCLIPVAALADIAFIESVDKSVVQVIENAITTTDIILPGIKGDKGDKGERGYRGYSGARGVGIPPGGSTGQSLVKKGYGNYSVEWRSISTSSVTWNDVQNKPDFKPVSVTGQYSSLQGKPTIPDVYTKLDTQRYLNYSTAEQRKFNDKSSITHNHSGLYDPYDSNVLYKRISTARRINDISASVKTVLNTDDIFNVFDNGGSFFKISWQSFKSFLDTIYHGLIVTWSEITGKPTTRAGYGITDAASQNSFANISTMAIKSYNGYKNQSTVTQTKLNAKQFVLGNYSCRISDGYVLVKLANGSFYCARPGSFVDSTVFVGYTTIHRVTYPVFSGYTSIRRLTNPIFIGYTAIRRLTQSRFSAYSASRQQQAGFYKTNTAFSTYSANRQAAFNTRAALSANTFTGNQDLNGNNLLRVQNAGFTNATSIWVTSGNVNVNFNKKPRWIFQKRLTGGVNIYFTNPSSSRRCSIFGNGTTAQTITLNGPSYINFSSWVGMSSGKKWRIDLDWDGYFLSLAGMNQQ